MFICLAEFISFIKLTLLYQNIWMAVIKNAQNNACYHGDICLSKPYYVLLSSWSSQSYIGIESETIYI